MAIPPPQTVHVGDTPSERLQALWHWRDLLHLAIRMSRVDEICRWFEDWLTRQAPHSTVQVIQDSPEDELQDSSEAEEL